MAVHVAGLWELGWSTPLREFDLWEQVVRDFGVASFHMAPVSGIAVSKDGVIEHADISKAIEQFRSDGVPVIFLDERAATPLQEFVHPPDALYVFGKVTLSAHAAYSKPGDLSVYVEVGQGRLWPHQIASIVLYDRWRKQQ